ncbi:MAG: hypothetical protein KKG84_03715, partial [Candidatus Omnitrophica bacterium]|nr:hypothetical protein [Candidatus Omnitrophota bacterium]
SSAERYAEDTEGESIPIKEEIRVIGIEHDSLTKEIDEQQEIYEKYSVLHENDIVLSEDKRECLSSAERLFLEKKAAYDGDLSALEEEKNIKEAELDETIRFIGTLNEGEILTADQAEAVFLVKLIVDEAEEDLMSAEAELELKQREYDTFLSARDEAYREYIEAKKIAGHAEWLKGLVCSIVEWWRKRQYDRAENEHIKALALLEAAKTNRALAAEAKDKALEYFNDIKVWIKNDNSKTYDDACVKKDTLQNEMDDIIFRTKAAETTLDLARKDRISAEKEYREALERELASSVVLDSQKDRLDGLKASLAELSGDLDGLKILLAEKEKEKKEAHTLLAGLKEQELCIFYELYEKRSEKDLYEENLKKVLAAVEQAEADLLEAEEILRIRGDIYVEVRDNGDKAVYKLKGMEYVVSTILCTDGTFIEYEYNENNETISCAKTLSSGDVEIYGSDGRLDKKYSADAGFVKGFNMPWNNYGYDLGKEPGSGSWIGFSEKKNELYKKMDLCRGGYVRVFLFCDLRSGMNFSADGTPLSFTEKVFEDMRTLLDTAVIFNVKLMPVLFDYTIADGITQEGAYKVGEHADLIADEAKRSALMDIFAGFFAEFASDPNIYAWDIINEPEYAWAVGMDQIREFVSGMTALIHSVSPDADVTVGSKDRQAMIDNWTDVGLDLYQFHHYDNFGEPLSLDRNVNGLGLDKPVIAGEIEPTAVSDKLEKLNNNGYSGGFFWEDGSGYTITDEIYGEIKDWFSGTTITYSYYASGRVSTEVYSDGMIREYDDIPVYEDGDGRIVKVTLSTGAYKTYEYYGLTGEVKNVCYFLPGGTLYSREEFDVQGGLISSALYYDDGQVKEIRNADGSWTEYSETGEILEAARYTEGIEIIRDGSGRIVRLIDGAYVEERKYVYEQEEVIYTLAIYGGEVKAVREGYCEDENVISRNVSPDASAMTVTYGNNVTVNYSDGDVAAISVGGGYSSFYNSDNVLYQNGPSGEFYGFEEGLLKQVATPGGNIYNFGWTSDEDGITISLSDAVINGVRCVFLGTMLLNLYSEGMRTDILDISLGNNLKINNLVVDMGSGEFTPGEGDQVFREIETILREIHKDVPNIKFLYSGDMEVQEILTSRYSKLYFQEGLIARTVSAEGAAVDYEYIKEGEEITGLKLSELNITRVFNKYGDLISLELNDNGETNTLDFDGGDLDSVESAGAVLKDISFDGEGNIGSARLFKADGSEYFFAGGELKDFIDSQNTEYEVDERGRIKRLILKDTGETFDAIRRIDPNSGNATDVFISEKGVEYIYQDDMLIKISDPSGLDVSYQYDTEKRTKEIAIFYGGVASSAYTYEYGGNGTTILDDIGNERLYNADNRIVSIKTPYGDTYFYDHGTDSNGCGVTYVNYTYKERTDGTVIEYFKGRIRKITRPDGSYIDNVVFNELTGALTSFSLHTSDNKHHNVITKGDLLMFEMEDSTRLVFYGDKLVAFAGSQGVVPLYDMGELDSIIYERDPSETGDPGVTEADAAGASWRHQTYENSQAIRFVEWDYSALEWNVNLDLEVGSQQYSQGEMYLDLRYDIPGLDWQAPIDMTDKEISFLFKLDGSFEFDPSCAPVVQIFAKDDNWNSCYGTRTEITSSSEWIKVSLILSDDNINLGYTDTRFDPSSIIMLGVRISSPENAPTGETCLGKMLVKNNILPDLFEKVNYGASPLDDLYGSLGLSRDLSLLYGEEGEETQDTYLEYFIDALENGPSNALQDKMLEMISWKVESEDNTIKGIESVYRDADSGDIIITADLSSVSPENTEGEVYYDIRTDVPGLGWDGSANLTSRSLRMLIEVPDELIGSVSAPNGARMFVEDINGKMQYGTWVNLKEGGKWYQLEITPTFGTIPMGYTDDGFDASLITKIGVNVSTQQNSNTDFQGTIRLKFQPALDVADEGTYVDMPLWMDIRNIKGYLIDEDDNYIRVPSLNYLTEGYFSYVFNKGSGEQPLADFRAIERDNTRWKVQGGGLDSVGWSPDGSLSADMNFTSVNSTGELLLDLRYPFYVPGMNWQTCQPLDMTGQEITFYVRVKDDYVSNTAEPLYMKAFVKDDPSWKTEYSGNVRIDASGEWTKVTLIPSPLYFNTNYADAGFDPKMIIAIGLTVQSASSSYMYSGALEIKYEINGVDLGVCGLGDTGILPSNPVWTDQKDLAEYLKQAGIALYGNYSIMSEVNRLIDELPEYSLPKDFAAFTVYDQDDNVTSISKPDGTTTWFDASNRIDFITFENGEVFIDYEYDPEDGLKKATLVRARHELTSAMNDAVNEIDRQTADMLLVLTEQKGLLEEDFMEGVNTSRSQFAAQRAYLHSQQYVEVKKKVLWWTETEIFEVPGVREAIDDLNAQEAEYNRQVSEQLAVLDDEIMNKKYEIDRQRYLVVSGYEWQGKKMLLSILHEEAIPVIYYYYRNILGRDAGEEEIRDILNRIDENNGFAGFFNEDILDIDKVMSSLQTEAEHPLYIDPASLHFSEDDTTLSVNKIITAFDGFVRSYGLYNDLAEYYGGGEDLKTILSERTVLYLEGLTCLGTESADLTDGDRLDLEWLNRYIIQDLYEGVLWKNRYSEEFNASSLKEGLLGSDEYIESESFKGTVTSNVLGTLRAVLNDTEAREALLRELGLEGEETIAITENSLAALTEWLTGQDAHFGRSAFGTLGKMIEETGKVCDMNELAETTLMIDILVGASGPMTDEKIEISMFAMEHAAEVFGVETSSARIDYENILLTDAPFITLLNVHHYVTVLDVTETEVTYWDSNIGAAGGEVTITRNEFEDNWQGNVITTASVDISKLLSPDETKKIKGSFFGLIVAAISFVFSAISAAVTGVTVALSGLMGMLGTMVSGIAAGITQAIAGLGNLFNFIGGSFMGALSIGGGAAGTAAASTAGLSLSTLMHSAVPTLIKIGVGYGTSIGLESMGVDPLVSGLISSIVTGGVAGVMEGGVDAVFKTAMQYGAATGMSMLGQHFDLDPVITSILSMSTAVLSGAALDGELTSFGKAIDLVDDHIIGELAYYGVQTAGEALGVDANISYLAGIGIRSSLQAGLSGIGGGGSPNDWIDGAILGLTQGVSQIGINYLMDELDLPPLVEQMGSELLS